MLKQVNGKWALVSKKTRRPLAYYKGEGKPSDAWVAKQERRIAAFKYGLKEQLVEAAYEGNIGIMELVKFHSRATKDQKDKLQSLLTKKQNETPEEEKKRIKHVWQHVQSVTGVKLHKSVHEAVSPDILPKSGAGQDGTDELAKTYFKDTPGQNYKKFRQFIKKN